MKLPAVRFVRCYDINEGRMVNVWQSITTQDQLDNAPRATELTVTAQTVEGAMVEIRKTFTRWMPEVTILEIEAASRNLLPALDSIYEARTA